MTKRNYNQKLSNEQTDEIKRLMMKGLNCKEIMAQTGLSKTEVGNHFYKRNTWKQYKKLLKYHEKREMPKSYVDEQHKITALKRAISLKKVQQIKVGDTVRLGYRGYRKTGNYRPILKGKITYNDGNIMVVQSETGLRESYSYTDILAGYIVIREVQNAC